MMGGTDAHEYMAPCAAGEDDIALAPGYAANVEVAEAVAKPIELSCLQLNALSYLSMPQNA